MLILGIETATQQVSVSIGGHEGVLGTFEVSRGRRHAETLVPAIEFLCRQTDVAIDEFGAIAVDIGPGLFTGMRVGLATGKAMAQALRIPMIGISSLDLLAFPLRHADRTIVSSSVCAAVHPRRSRARSTRATSSAGSPGLRGPIRTGTFRPVTRSTAAMTSRTDEGRSVPTL